MKCFNWSIALYSAEIWTLRTADQKYLESFEMWCWRRMEISLTDRVRNGEVLHSRVKEERTLLHTVKRRKANWIGKILRRNCLLFLCLFVFLVLQPIVVVFSTAR
jgi:hypothetical protein